MTLIASVVAALVSVSVASIATGIGAMLPDYRAESAAKVAASYGGLVCMSVAIIGVRDRRVGSFAGVPRSPRRPRAAHRRAATLCARRRAHDGYRGLAAAEARRQSAGERHRCLMDNGSAEGRYFGWVTVRFSNVMSA
jgi:hypothetical protein